MKYSSCWCNVSGKVFVSEDELMEKLCEIHPDKCRWDSELAVWVTTTTAEEERNAFEIVACNKIHEFFDTDEPMKLGEIEIDMDTYKS